MMTTRLTYVLLSAGLVCACGSGAPAAAVAITPTQGAGAGAVSPVSTGTGGSSRAAAGAAATHPSSGGMSSASAGSQGGAGAQPSSSFAGRDAAGNFGAGSATIAGGGRPQAGAQPSSSAGTGGAMPVATGDCGANLLPSSDDLHQRGPWDAGVRTVKAGRVTLELFYPAQPGSSQGKPEATYKHSDWLPAPEQAKTKQPIEPVGALGGHLYRDLPIDELHGPYPVVIFIHGTASMRGASISTNAHWASRGFVVLVADYPGLGLTDQLNAACGYPAGEQDVEGDVQAQLAALKSVTGDFAFLSGHVDLTRLALAGHSQGACMSATLASLPNVRLVIPISGSTQVSPGPDLASIMWLAGMDDTVIGYQDSLLGNVVCPANPLPATSDVGAFEASPGPPTVIKRLAGIRGGGHLSVTDLCQKNSLGHTDLEQMQMDGVCGVDTAVIIGLPALFDCGTIDWKKGVDAVNYVTTAALEETLQCRDRTAQFAAIRTNVPELGDFRDR